VKAQVKGTLTLEKDNLSDLANTTFKNTFELTMKTIIAAAAIVSPNNVTISGYSATNPALSNRLQRRLAQAQVASGLSVDFVVEFPPVMTTTAELAAMNSTTGANSTSINPAASFAGNLKKNEVLTGMFSSMAGLGYGNVTLANVQMEQQMVFFVPPPSPPPSPRPPPPFLPSSPRPPKDDLFNKGTSDGVPVLPLVGAGIGVAVVVLLGYLAMVIRGKRRLASKQGSGTTKVHPFDDDEEQ
jgi:hypothetical protein